MSGAENSVVASTAIHWRARWWEQTTTTIERTNRLVHT